MTVPLVLIVESHPMLREVLADLIRLDDLDTLTASTAPEALSLAYAHRPALWVIHLNLSGELGSLELLDAIRHDPQLAPTPVVLLVSDPFDHPLPADDDQLLILKMLDLDHLNMAIRCLLLDRPRSAKRIASGSPWT